MPIAKQLELDKYNGFIIAYNGSQIIEAKNEEVIFERRINPELLPYLEKKARKNNFAIFTYKGNKIITNSPENRYILNEALINRMEVIHEKEFSTAIDFAPTQCVLVSDDEEALTGLEGHWKRRLDGPLDVCRTEK